MTGFFEGTRENVLHIFWALQLTVLIYILCLHLVFDPDDYNDSHQDKSNHCHTDKRDLRYHFHPRKTVYGLKVKEITHEVKYREVTARKYKMMKW